MKKVAFHGERNLRYKNKRGFDVPLCYVEIDLNDRSVVASITDWYITSDLVKRNLILHNNQGSRIHQRFSQSLAKTFM